MNFGEILDIVWTILAIIAFIGIIIFTIKYRGKNYGI